MKSFLIAASLMVLCAASALAADDVMAGDLPPGTPNPNCAPIVAHKLGDTWKSKDSERTITLKAGMR